MNLYNKNDEKFCPFAGDKCRPDCIFRRNSVSSADYPCYLVEACRLTVAAAQNGEHLSNR